MTVGKLKELLSEETTEKQISDVVKNTLAAFLYYGSEKKAYEVLQEEYGRRNVPNVIFLLGYYGIVPEPKSRPEPEIAELDELFNQLRYGEYDQSTLPERLQKQITDIERAFSNHEATLLFLRESPLSQQLYIGRDKLRGNTKKYKQPLWTFPMTYSERGEDPRISLLRVLQQEVLLDIASEGRLGIDSFLANQIIPENVEPLFELYQYDVVIKAYELILPSELHYAAQRASDWTRLENAGFANTSSLVNKNPLDSSFRYGFLDALKIREKYFLNGANSSVDGRFMSSLNQLVRDAFPLPYGYLSVPA